VSGGVIIVQIILLKALIVVGLYNRRMMKKQRKGKKPPKASRPARSLQLIITPVDLGIKLCLSVLYIQYLC
jgi:putative copper export protein